MQKLVVLTGAGISAESGISTFRDSGGLWEQYRIEDVATPEAWKKDKALVLEFYNQRRKQLLQCKPNNAHKRLVDLEQYFDVYIITQNVDDLHERAGSKQVLHLHGELRKAQSSLDPSLVYPIEGWELKLGDKCEKGSQLRPFIVWFGEPVPMMDKAIELTEKADIFVVIGTSLQVYPAASLLQYVKPHSPIFIIDPNDVYSWRKATHIKEKASVGGEKLISLLKEI
ncbi:MAG: NAD-dependent deacylase [Bacteroidales bacterium]|nr:NAD-dependent deacylase [Bacteroidales bacterium]